MSKSHWNYRLLAYPDGDEVYFCMHEVYYNEQGIPNGATLNGASVGGNNQTELNLVLQRMQEALQKPILWGDERFPQEYQIEKQTDHDGSSNTNPKT